MTSQSSLVRATFLTGVCLAVAACSSPDTRREEFKAKIGPPQPPLSGKADYFDGKISAVAYLNPAFRPRPSREGEGDEDRERSHGHPPGSGRGGEGMYGEGRRRGGGGEGREMMGPGGPHAGSAGGAGMVQPRQALTVTLTNASNAPITVQIVEVNSNLGNFVPVPEKATLSPGESVTLEPMRGALANLDEFPLKLGLKGDGKNEQRTVLLKRLTAE